MTKYSSKDLRKLSLDKLHELLKNDEISIEEIEENIPLEELLKKFPDVDEDPDGGEPGVLLSDEIERYVDKFHLIFPFKEKNLKAASYRLTVGNEYALGGKKEKLYTKDDKIVIPPFQVAIIKTREIINMPRFLIGRWNIRVTQAYKGLLWVGGPQVDPGWVGHLFCPVYNLSNEEVELKLGEPLATIDFIRTTSFKKGKCKEFDRLPRRKQIDDYEWKLKSALFTEAGQRIGEIENRMNKVEERVEKEIEKLSSKLDRYIGVVFTIVAIIIAALSILVTSGQQISSASVPIWVKHWVIASVVLAIIAIAFSLFSRVKLEIKNPWLKTIVGIFYITYVIISIVAIVRLGVEILWR